jgi:transcriptional regulator with XRE-family HTH domain
MSESPQQVRDGQVLSESLKSIRRLRGLSAVEVSGSMNISLRTYQDFEAGRGRLNEDYVHRFARATNSDPHAILHAVKIGSPQFAVWCADNKFLTVFEIELQRFDETMGERIRSLEPRELIIAISTMFSLLESESRNRESDAKTWLEQGQAAISRRRPKPGR